MALIVVFAALAGASGSIDGIVGFRSLLAAADAGPHGEPDVVGGVADEFGGAPGAVDSELRSHARPALRTVTPDTPGGEGTAMVAGQRVRTGVDGDVWRVTLDSPATGNAVDPAMAAALGEALHTRPPETRAVLLLAEGERFCVGGDVRGFAAAEDPGAEVGRLAVDWHGVVRALLASPVPVVAGVQGAVAGAGVGLLGACDVVVCARSTKIRPAYGAIGFSPDGGTSWTLAHALGPARALDLVLTNGTLDAAAAQACGLVARVVEDDGLRDAAVALAHTLAAGPVRAMVRTRALVRGAAVRTLQEHLDDEARLIAESAGDPEGREGVRAFVEKRRPDFRGAR